jgi:hypothetical protein
VGYNATWGDENSRVQARYVSVFEQPQDLPP